MLALHTAAAAALASFAALRPSILPRPAIVCMCDAAKPAPSVELVDIDGDEIVFSIIDTKLQMFVNGDFVCEDVDTLEYATSDGRVRQNEGEGNFQLLEGPERGVQATALRGLAEAAGIDWREDATLPELDYGEEDDEEEGEWELDVTDGEEDDLAALLEAAEGIALPDEVETLLSKSTKGSFEAKLTPDEELTQMRPGAVVLWSRLLKIYPSEAAAIAAVQRNSALIMPYMNKPAFIDGSWRVLNEMMSEEEALEVITKNPGILACNPVGLKTTDAATVKRAAGFVNGVEGVFDATWRKLFK